MVVEPDGAADVSFRAAVAADLPAVVRMLREDVLVGTSEPPDAPIGAEYVDAFEVIRSDERQLLVVADRGGEIVGTMQLSFLPYLTFGGGQRAQIEAVRVHASARGQGIGGRMIRWAIDVAHERGCHMVQLTTDKRRTDARRFYESLGFEATHEGMKLHL